jgi:hypothetical protein
VIAAFAAITNRTHTHTHHAPTPEITMPAIPVASDKLTVFAMSDVRPAPARAELSDGTTRVIPGEQAKHKHSQLPLWQLDCVVPGEQGVDNSRALNLTVKIATMTKPVVTPGMPVRFVDLAVLAYVDNGGRAALSWSASGVEPAHAAHRPSEKAA